MSVSNNITIFFVTGRGFIYYIAEKVVYFFNFVLRIGEKYRNWTMTRKSNSYVEKYLDYMWMR